MPSILPTTKLAPTRFNPKILVTYGMPKVGKTTEIAKLESCLIEDMEEGAVSIDAMRVPVKYIDGKTIMGKDKDGKEYISAISFNEVMNQMMVYAGEYMKENPGKKPPYLYKRICLDTMDKFEDMCIISATTNYRNTILGKNFDGASVMDLPKGAGYFYLRNEVLDNIEKLSNFCETLILNCHTKDKIVDVGGIELTSKDLSLTGRLGAMVCAKADAILYWYREQNKPLMASLETLQNGGVMGARPFPHLQPLLGTKFEFSWDKILVDPTKAT